MADGEKIRVTGRFSPASCCNGWDWRLYNILILGFAFMLLFTAFQTSSMAEQSVLEGAKTESNGTFKGDGYTSLAIIYAVFAGANWIAPSVVSVVGPKISMLLGGICYSLFIASFLKPMTWSLYTGSVLVGIGAAIIWTGQGTALIQNSDPETVGRNSGIFWALLQCSLLFGNLYVYFAFQGEVKISADSRFTVFSVLTAVSVAGLIILIFLKSKVMRSSEDGNFKATVSTRSEGPLQALINSGKLMVTKEMLLLSVAFAYTGLELTFFSGVYGTCVGHTLIFGDSKSMIGLCGMLIGIGEIMGGGLFGLAGKQTNRYGRDPIVMLGYLSHMLCFYLVFLNLPMDSPINDTFKATYISAKYVAFFCAFLLGLGDSSFNTQIYSLLGVLYENDSAPAIALFKFVQSLAAAVGFFYSNHLLLQYQLLILVISGTLGAWCFFIIEWAASRKYHANYHQM